DNADVTASPRTFNSLTASPRVSTAPPTSTTGKLGQLGLSIEDSSDGVVVKWISLPDAVWYKVSGSAKYGGSCDLVSQGVTATEDTTFSEKVLNGEQSFTLPKPNDERLTTVLLASINVDAYDAADSILASDSTALNGHPQC
ncbi:MAG: hypothetical protein ABI559_06235, partial [Chloroflexota bacterium]